MTKILLTAVILAAAASARAQSACAPNAELDAKSFALWITPSANPDSVPCAARLAQISCAAAASGFETRAFASADGRYSASYRYSATSDSGVAISLEISGASNVSDGVVALATYPYRLAWYKGVGQDDVQIFDAAAQRTKSIGNVMLIPVDALTAGGQAQCPAN
jgi:hypothetical protein